MSYKVEFMPKAVKQIKKLDKLHAKQITNWISKNLVNCPNPYLHGKSLKGNLSEYWRYRVGDYRILAKIDSLKIKIFIFKIGNRKEIYG